MQSILKYKDIWIWPAIVLLIHVIATIMGTYYVFLWFDSPMHFIGGISIALSAHYFLDHDKQTKTTPLTYLMFIVGTTAVAAVAWELLEFCFDYFGNSRHQPGLADTMKDLFIGTAAATITALLLLTKRRTRK